MKVYYCFLVFTLLNVKLVMTKKKPEVSDETATIDKEVAAKTRFKFYSGSSIDNAIITNIPLENPQDIDKHLDSTKPLVIFIHGFREDPSGESVSTIVGAYLQRGTDNIVLFDWSELASEFYLTVVNKVPKIARSLAWVLNRFQQIGINVDTLHIIGFSLGAQVAGLAGKLTTYSIPRITGLDPAKLGFYHPGAEHIDAKSAKFVDIIHTDGGFYGMKEPTGTVDFFANTGTRPQPGCSLVGVPMSDEDVCGHRRAWRYYAETVVNNNAFSVTSCISGILTTHKICLPRSLINVGYSVSHSVLVHCKIFLVDFSSLFVHAVQSSLIMVNFLFDFRYKWSKSSQRDQYRSQ